MSWGVRMQYKTIGEICTVVSGTTPKSDKAEYWGGNLIWITPAELKEGNAVIYDSVRHITKAAVKASALKPFPKGTVILSSRAPIGKVAIAGTQMYCNQGFKNLICSEVIYNGYLYYYLKAKTAYLNSLGRGATFREISKQIVEKIKIPVPSMQEQHRIADILFKIDALMGKRQQQAEKLDELVKARFVEMFGECKYGGDPLSNVCKLITDGTHQSPQFVDAGIPFLLVSNLVHNEITYDTEKFISKESYQELIKRTPVEIGDILLSIVGSYGHAGVVRTDKPFCFQRHIAYIKPDFSKLNSEFLHQALLSDAVKYQMEKRVKGIAQKTLNLSELKKIVVPIPPLVLQTEFSHFVHEVDREKERIQRSAALLETLKRSLMQQYFG